MNVTQIAKSIEKLFNAGFDDDKLILAMQLEDVQKIEGITIQDINIIIKFKKAIRTKQIVKFLTGKEIFKELVRDSITYMVNNRCGIDNDDYTYKLYFEKINYIADPEIISLFGNACRDLTRDILRETRAFVKNRTIALTRKNVYVIDKEVKEKGGIENANSNDKLQTDKGLSDTRVRSNEKSNESELQVRNSEGELLENSQTEPIRYDDNAGNIDSSFERDTTRMRETTGNQNRTENKEGQLDRTVERSKSSRMGTEDEFDKNGSGKRTNEGIGTGIDDDILSETEQINFIENLIEDDNREKTVTDFELESQKLQSFFISENKETLKADTKELN